jgi:hypothetical protein
VLVPSVVECTGKEDPRVTTAEPTASRPPALVDAYLPTQLTFLLVEALLPEHAVAGFRLTDVVAAEPVSGVHVLEVHLVGWLSPNAVSRHTAAKPAQYEQRTHLTVDQPYLSRNDVLITVETSDGGRDGQTEIE